MNPRIEALADDLFHLDQEIDQAKLEVQIAESDREREEAEAHLLVLGFERADLVDKLDALGLEDPDL
ncbi:hypothetical protein SEA_JACKO_94 [Microbacterium phage Jacko]|nr:hypothetical protein SEA_JACKO_94 [Microbacterium phage Jacko]